MLKKVAWFTKKFSFTFPLILSKKISTKTRKPFAQETTYLQKNCIHFLTIQTTPNSLQNILKRNVQLVTFLALQNPEFDFPPLGHDPNPNTFPRLQDAHQVFFHDETNMQNAAVGTVFGVQGTDDDVVVGFGDSEVAGM